MLLDLTIYKSQTILKDVDFDWYYCSYTSSLFTVSLYHYSLNSTAGALDVVCGTTLSLLDVDHYKSRVQPVRSVGKTTVSLQNTASCTCMITVQLPVFSSISMYMLIHA